MHFTFELFKYAVMADKPGTVWKTSECVSLSKQLKDLHEDRIRTIDEELGSDGMEIKNKALQSRISDLEEQNALFVEIMEQLEQEQLASSAQSEELQRMHIQKLQSDVTNLLKFLRRVREKNSWDATGLTFNEVTYEDIFSTEDMTSDLCGPCRHTDGAVHNCQISTAVSISVETTQSTHQNQDKDAIIADLNDENLLLLRDLEILEDGKGREVSELREEIVMLKSDIERKYEQIQGFVRRIQAFHNKIHNNFNEGCIEHQSLYGNTVNEPSHDEILKWSLEYLDEDFQRALEERRELTAEVKLLQKELKESKGETEQLSNMVNYMKLSIKDIRESLTAEVAEKHSLRHTVRLLQRKCRDTELRVLLRDDVIMELRNRVRAAGFKCNSSNPDDKNVMKQLEHQLEQVNVTPDESEDSI